MKITDITCHVLIDPEYDPAATSSAQDDIVVEIHTDEGITGIGECDVNPWVARACIEAPGTHTMDQGLKSVLIGTDPTDIAGLWKKMYTATAMPGRRGAMIHAIGAIDMALWDIAGKAAGLPVWKLLGTQRAEPLRAYASLEPEISDFDSYVRQLLFWASEAQRFGFPAVKLETTFSGPYANMGHQESDEAIAEILHSARSAMGPDIDIMIDVQYAFDSVERASKAISSWDDARPYFVEAPLWLDDIAGYAELSTMVSTPLAAGEWNSTRHEFDELVRAGNLEVLQPDVGRVGGISEMLAVCQLAADHGRTLVPHAWKTGITVAATAHVAAVTPNMPYFEFLHPDLCESRLRKELVEDEVVLRDGSLTLPQKPGLGVELNRDALNEFTAAAKRLYDC